MENNDEINLDRLVKASNGDESFIRSMLELFVARTPAMLNDLKDACENKDDIKTVRLAHQLKPSVDMIGNPQMRNLLMKLHALTQENADCTDSSQLVNEFLLQAEKSIALIKIKLNSEKLF